MRTHSEERRLPYASEYLFDIIADVDRYVEFLPWCVASRVRERREGQMTADLSIGYGSLRETFTSRVELDPAAGRIRTTQESGPFRELESIWTLRADGGATVVGFSIRFAFRSVLLDRLMGAVFDRAARKMIEAFEARAAELQ